jgi:hypothetical protein
MPTATNIAFTELIKINGRLREFNFRKRNERLYHVDTADERGTRYMFQLLKDGDAWKIEGIDIPGWIMNSQSLLEEIVTRY